ncbi:MAG: glycoside hydrolase domain-containing protein, partial [Opitutaceae bacterium]
LEEGFAKGYVGLSNEPNLQAPFLFNYSGKPWLTQKYTRWILGHNFDSTPYRGCTGEEDEGQMSSYYIMLALGLFEMKGGCETTPQLDLSSPLFDKVVLHLDPAFYKGSTFTIETRNNSKENVYIQSVELNGRPIAGPRIDFKSITDGGTIIFNLGPKPNEAWGK